MLKLVHTGIQVMGLTSSASSLLAMPVHGAVGFVVRPVTGSAAAAWLPSIRDVEAGSP